MHRQPCYKITYYLPKKSKSRGTIFITKTGSGIFCCIFAGRMDNGAAFFKGSCCVFDSDKQTNS